MRRRVLTAVVAVLAVAGSATALTTAAATTSGTARMPEAAPADAGRGGSTGGAPKVLPRVTRVHAVVHPDGRQVDFRPGPGRAAVAYRSLVLDGHHYLIPADAELLVASGALDIRLFDITALLAAGAATPLRVTRDADTPDRTVPRDAAGETWDNLTEPVPETRGAGLGSRRLRVGVRKVTLGPDAAPSPVSPAAADDVELTITYRDRNGRATGTAYSRLHNIDHPGPAVRAVPGPDGTATIRLPAGRYFVESNVDTPRPHPALPSTTVTVNPQLTLDQDTEVTVDARAARPVSITVPDRAAISMGALAGHWRLLKDLRIASVYGNPDATALYTAHEGPKVPATEFEAAVGAFYGRPGRSGTTADSPLTYAAAWKQSGRFFTGLRRKVGEAELSTVRAGHVAVAPGRSAEKVTAVELSLSWAGSNTADTTVPFNRVERYAGNVRWINSVTEYAAGTNLADAVVQRQSPATYRPGRRYVERWGETPYWPSARLLRDGDLLWIQSLAMFCDTSGTREGTGSYRRALVQLHRDGHLVDQADRLEDIPFTLVPDPTRYQLTAEVERDWTDLATRTRVVWTFGTTTAPAGQPVTLPLMSVRFTPADGARGPLAVHVMRAAPGPAVRSLAVEASYDGGRTWRPAQVTRAGDRWAAVLPDPPATAAVSLRARAVNGAGDTVEQETVNAYRLR